MVNDQKCKRFHPRRAFSAAGPLNRRDRPRFEQELLEWKYSIKRDWGLYLLLLIPVVCVIVFNYAAYPGLRIAFMDYKPAKGYIGSDYVGLQQFVKSLSDSDFYMALRNTLVFNLLALFLSFPMPILLAILLNELKSPAFKKVNQTILYLPHFLSWPIIAAVALTLFKPGSGIINVLLKRAGLISEGIPFLNEPGHWAVTYLLIGVWQSMGWGTILYLAAITGIDPSLYEAATVDGAGRVRKMWHVTLPGIRATIVTLLIMNLGRMLGSNYEPLSAFYNPNVREYQFQLAIYVYEKGLSGGNYSRAAAVGLFQSLTSLILVLTADRVSKALGEDGLL